MNNYRETIVYVFYLGVKNFSSYIDIRLEFEKV